MSSLLYLKLFKIPYLLNSDGGFIKKENKITYYIKRFFISGAKLTYLLVKALANICNIMVLIIK